MEHHGYLQHQDAYSRKHSRATPRHGRGIRHRKGWTEHCACRHSAGHMYLDDTELCSIPPRIAERASRIGYKLKSFITWRKHTAMPEPAKSRVSRQAEYILHLSIDRTPFFDKEAWQTPGPSSAGRTRIRVSGEDHRCLVSPGVNGSERARRRISPGARGALYRLDQPRGRSRARSVCGIGDNGGRCCQLRRRCLGYDISEKYIDIAVKRLTAASERGRKSGFAANSPDIGSPSVNAS